MPDVNIKKIKQRALKINAAWEEGAPSVEFSGIKQTEYDAEIVAAEAVEDEITDLKAQIKMKEEERDDKYRGVDKNSVRVANGVRGDKNFGPDSPLYGAMGFVRTSDRASGLTRKTKPSSGE